MSIYMRCTRLGAVVAILALGVAPGLRAQDTTAVKTDTSAYRSYDTSQAGPGADTGKMTTKRDSNYQYTGPSTDTALKAKPGVQTGPSKGDTSKTAGAQSIETNMVVCKDGSTETKAGSKTCSKHGGIDKAATKAALRARGEMRTADSVGTQSDTGKTTKHDSSFEYTGPPSDTALKAKPGVQTGPSAGDTSGVRSDSASADTTR
jgi:hypothetical protein